MVGDAAASAVVRGVAVIRAAGGALALGVGVAASAAPGSASGAAAVKVHPFGFVDVGWFATGGDGAGYARLDDCDDPSCPLWQAHEDVGWVFAGDPWATTVNSQGDPADLGNAFNPHPRYDRIASGGRPTFLVNAVELGAEVRAGAFTGHAAVWAEPARGFGGQVADQLSVDVAWIRWRDRSGGWSVSAGQVESVFGIEWWQRPPDRWNVTPSLMARYTTGTPLGVALTGALRPWLQLAASVTNGDTSTERFGQLVDTLDTNGVPTVTARVGATTHGKRNLRVGLSGEVGAQDGVRDVVPMFQVGADIALNTERVYVQAEFVFVDENQPGADLEERDSLRARGGWLEVAAPLGRVWPLVRVDQRRAVLSLPEAGNHYDSDVVRLTAGARVTVTSQLTAKAEYLRIWELGTAPIPDDVFTTSIVFAVR